MANRGTKEVTRVPGHGLNLRFFSRRRQSLAATARATGNKPNRPQTEDPG